MRYSIQVPIDLSLVPSLCGRIENRSAKWKKRTVLWHRRTTVVVYHHNIRMQLIGSTSYIEVSVGFTDAPGVDAILGQADFFQEHQSNLNVIKNS